MPLTMAWTMPSRLASSSRTIYVKIGKTLLGTIWENLGDWKRAGGWCCERLLLEDK